MAGTDLRKMGDAWLSRQPVRLSAYPEVLRVTEDAAADGPLTAASPGLDRSCHIIRPVGEVVISMGPVGVFANRPGSEIEQLQASPHGRWRQATRAVMVLLSAHGLPLAQIADLPDCHRPPCTTGSAGSTLRGWPGWRTGPGWAAMKADGHAAVERH